MSAEKTKISYVLSAVLLVAAFAFALAVSSFVIGCGDGNTNGGGTTSGGVTSGGEITSFEECAARGYPVMESYPARCVANGKEFVQTVDDPSKLEPPTVTTTAEFEELSSTMRLKQPHSGDVVQSPLIVEGEAGGWYFEGEFPVKLLDSGGSVIARGNALAQGDWMTTDLVPFKVTLTFTAPVGATGALVLDQNNPRDGVPGKTAQISVRFVP